MGRKPKNVKANADAQAAADHRGDHGATILGPIQEAEKQLAIEKLMTNWHKAITRGQRGYKAADTLMDKLLAIAPVGTTVRIDVKGTKFDLTVIDQFADKNKVWAGSSCARFKIEAKEVKPVKAKEAETDA